VGYVFNVKDPVYGIQTETEIQARDSLGRPRIVHTYDGVPGQFRGISVLAPALQLARQYDQFANATLTSAILQNVFAATLESPLPTAEAMEGLLTQQEQAQLMKEGGTLFGAWQDAMQAWSESIDIDLGVPGRIAHTFPGQKLEFKGAITPLGGNKDFALYLMRELARCMGLMYESLTGDYEGVTFSSIRMATGSNHKVVRMRRKNILAPPCQAAYEAWFEEEVERGGVQVPGGPENFIKNRAALCRAEWKGSPQLQPDDTKTATAQAMWQKMGIKSDTMLAAENGDDYEEVLADRAREMEARKRLKLPEPEVGIIPPPPSDGEDKPGKGKKVDG